MILAVLKHEESSLEIKNVLEDAVFMHATAALQTEQIHAFDKLTEELNKMRWTTCELVEAIVEWRRSKRALAELNPDAHKETLRRAQQLEELYSEEDDSDVTEMGPLPEPGALPFIWNDENALTKLVHCLDFLDSCEPLKEWYGSDFSLRANPFMLAVPVLDRAPTPRKPTQTVLVNGVKVERLIPRLVELAAKMAKVMKAADSRQRSSASWWPGARLNDAEIARVRRAEKEIVIEFRREKLRNMRNTIQERILAGAES